MPICSLPYIPWFRKWYNDQFKDICQKHDNAYTAQTSRIQADLELTSSLILRGYPLLAFLSYVFIRIVGYWKYKKAGKVFKQNKVP